MSETTPVIYILDASIAITGAFISARDEVRSLNGVTRSVLVLPHNHTIPAEQLTDFWRVETIPLVTLSKRVGPLLRYLPTLLIGSWQLRALMKRDGATRLHINDFFLLHGAVLRLLGYRGHIATWVRCDPVRFVGPLTRPILWLVHRTSDRMIAVSRFIQSLLPQHYNAEILYNFYTGPIRTPRIWGTEEEKVFLYVGNYIIGKGQDMALEAFARAAAQDATIRLHFYGGDMGLQKNRDYRKRLETRTQQLGLDSRVKFHDLIFDTYAALQNAYAGLNCSVSESFSRTVLEASGAGVAVIATASGGPQEILVDGTTGYLIPVGDTDAATNRILTLAKDPNRTATMGKAGAAHINTHFSPQALRQKLMAILALDKAGL